MQCDDSDTYFHDAESEYYESLYTETFDQFGEGPGFIHKGGHEIECNLTGKYVHLLGSMV